MSVTLKRNYNSFLESHQNEPCFSPKFNPTNIFNSSNSITPENFQQSQQEQREYFPSAKRMRPNNFSNNFEYKSNRVNYFPYGHQIVPYGKIRIIEMKFNNTFRTNFCTCTKFDKIKKEKSTKTVH